MTGASSGPGAQTAALDVTDPAAVDREKAMTDSVGALAQCEAALEVFRRQQRGHLELVGSTSALRGMRRSMTVYAATEAGVVSLAEGRRSERTRGMVDTGTGVRAMVAAIEARKAKAYVPTRPWVPIGVAMRVLPLPVVRRLS